MRIVYLNQHFRTPEMSGGTHIYEMARRWVDPGHEVHIVTTDQTQDTGRKGGWVETQEAGMHVHWLSVPYSNNMAYAQRMRAFLSFAIRASFKAASLRPDVVIAMSTPLTIALPGVFAARRNKVPMVFEVQDLWPEIPIALGALRNPVMKYAARMLEQFAYRNASHVVAAAPGMRDGVIRAGYPAEKVSVIPNSCDFERFDVDPAEGRRFRATYDWLQDRPLVAYTGTLGIVNGLGYLARVAAQAWEMDPEVRFLVVGSGIEEDKVRTLASQLGVLNKNFFMIPQMPKREIAAVASAASLMVSTVIDVEALKHNSANKFFDSLAASRPVAINHEGWFSELIREEEVGLVLSANDHREAARQLVTAVRDEAWLRSAGQRAYALGKARFSRNDLSMQLLGVLEDAVRDTDSTR